MSNDYKFDIGDVAEYAPMSLGTSLIEQSVERIRKNRQRVEKALLGAIRAGYNGADVRYNSHTRMQVDSVNPWHDPPKKFPKDLFVVRYTWSHYSDPVLTALCHFGYGRDLDDDQRALLAPLIADSDTIDSVHME